MKKEILEGLNVVNIEVNGTIVDPLDLKETPMFANRETLMEAFEYAQGVLDRCTEPEASIHGTTALQVIWNTLATKYHLIPKEDGGSSK